MNPENPSERKMISKSARSTMTIIIVINVSRVFFTKVFKTIILQKKIFFLFSYFSLQYLASRKSFINITIRDVTLKTLCEKNASDVNLGIYKMSFYQNFKSQKVLTWRRLNFNNPNYVNKELSMSLCKGLRGL